MVSAFPQGLKRIIYDENFLLENSPDISTPNSSLFTDTPILVLNTGHESGFRGNCLPQELPSPYQRGKEQERLALGRLSRWEKPCCS
jgi:hypothetical protein